MSGSSKVIHIHRLLGTMCYFYEFMENGDATSSGISDA